MDVLSGSRDGGFVTGGLHEGFQQGQARGDGQGRGGVTEACSRTRLRLLATLWYDLATPWKVGSVLRSRPRPLRPTAYLYPWWQGFQGASSSSSLGIGPFHLRLGLSPNSISFLLRRPYLALR